MDSEPPRESEALTAFHELYSRDVQSGRVRALGEYLDLFPATEVDVASAYLALERDRQRVGAGRKDNTEATLAISDSTRGRGGVSRVGPYRILKEIGRGGQGVVYLAEDTRYTRHRVALKVLDGTSQPAETIGRFRREAEIVTRLDHPNICAFKDAGTEDGLCYIAMQFIEGQTLSSLISRGREEAASKSMSYVRFDNSSMVDEGAEQGQVGMQGVSPEGKEREISAATSRTRKDVDRMLEIVEKAARALHAAHESGVIHRDVKPGNIMVRTDGEPVILDFGLARADDAELRTLTHEGDVFGTPAYMSPEQLTGHRIRLDRRTDVWSLGVTLYECIAWERPFHAPTRDGLYREILSKDPGDPRRAVPSIGEDVRWVIEAALEKDLDKRYQTALDLAEDLRRLRMREPIQARPVTSWIRLQRWTERNPVLARTVLAAALILVAATILSLSLAMWALRSAKEAEEQSKVADRERQSADAQRSLAETQRNVAMWRSWIVTARSEFPDDPAMRAMILREVDPAWRDPYSERRSIEAVRGAYHLVSTLPHEKGVTGVSWSPDGGKIATVSEDSSARVWSADGWKELEGARESTLGWDDVAWTRDGLRIVAGSRKWVPSPDGTRLAMASDVVGDLEIQVVDTIDDRAEPITLVGHEDFVRSITWSPNGVHLASVSEDRTARIWRSDGLGEPRVLAGHEAAVNSAAWSPDGSRLATASTDGVVRVWTLSALSEPVILRGHQSVVHDIAWSPDAGRIATASMDDTVRIWSADGNGEPAVFAGHTDQVWRSKWSPDGSQIATASADGTARIWNLDSTEEPAAVFRHRGAVLDVSWSPDGTRVVTASQDATARVWDVLGHCEPRVLRGEQIGAADSPWSADGTRLATLSDDRAVRIWSAAGEGDPVVLLGHEWRVFSASWSPDGAYLATASDDRTARIWNADGTEAPVILRGHQKALRHVAWSPDGTRIATASEDHTARIWDSTGQGSAFVLTGHSDHVLTMSWHVSGLSVVSVSRDGTARLWRHDHWEATPSLLDEQKGVHAVAWNPDGTRLALAGPGSTACVLTPDVSSHPVVLKGHEMDVWHVAWRPDGEFLATRSDDASVRVWRSDGFGDPVVFRDPETPVHSVAWSPDGGRLVATCNGGLAYVWNADGLGEVMVLRGHQPLLPVYAYWSPDGRRIATSSQDRTVRVWAVDWPLLRRRLWEFIPDLLQPKDRVRFLGETEQQAVETHKRQKAERDKRR